MSFTVEPLIHDDFDEFIKVWWDAFAPETADQLLPMIYPGGLSPELKARLQNRITAACDGDLQEFCTIAREPDTRRIVGIAWWLKVQKPSPPKDDAAVKQELTEMLKAKNTDPQVPGMNEELGDACYTAIYNAERETIQAKQVPYITLSVLAVLPEFGRRGVGTLLLEKGLEAADKLNIWTFLLAASMGKTLYERYGFEIVKEFDFDGRHYGGRSKAQHWVMWRPAQNQSPTSGI